MTVPSHSDSKQRPRHLAAVEPGATPAAAASTARPGSRLTGVLAVALGVALLGWVLSAQNGAALETSLEASNAALAKARAELLAYEGHVTAAHDQAAVLFDELTALTGRLGGLQSLLADRPVAGQPVPTVEPDAQVAPEE